MKIIRILSLIIISIFLVDNAYGQSRFKKIKKNNLSKEAKKIKKEGWTSMSGNLEKDISDYYYINEMKDEEGNLKNIVGVGSFTHHNLEEALYVSNILAIEDISSQIEVQIRNILKDSTKIYQNINKNLNFIIDNFFMNCSSDSLDDKSNFRECVLKIFEYNSVKNSNKFLIIDYDNSNSYFMIFTDSKDPLKIELIKFIDFGFDLKSSYNIIRKDNGEILIQKINNIGTSIDQIMTWYRKVEDKFEVQKSAYFNYSK